MPGQGARTTPLPAEPTKSYIRVDKRYTKGAFAHRLSQHVCHVVKSAIGDANVYKRNGSNVSGHHMIPRPAWQVNILMSALRYKQL